METHKRFFLLFIILLLVQTFVSAEGLEPNATYYNNLSMLAQSYVNYSSQQDLKSLFLFTMFSFSLIYIFYISKQQKQTPFFSIGSMRFFLILFSWINFVTFPLQIFFFFPQIDFWFTTIIYVSFYFLILLIFIIGVFIDMNIFGWHKLMEAFGIDEKDERIKAGLRWLFPKKEF